MTNYKILKFAKISLNVFWYLQLLVLFSIIFIALLLMFDVDFVDLNLLNGFKIHYSKIIFSDPLLYDGKPYDFVLTNGEGRLHINDLDQKFVYLRMLGSFADSFIYLMIIYFLRKLFKNLTLNKYFVSANGDYIKKVAISIILLALIPDLIYYFTDNWIAGSLHLDTVIIKNEFNFNYQILLLGLMVFVISIVFLRGIELKEEQELTI